MSFVKDQTAKILLFLFLISTLFYSQGLSVHGLEYRDDEIFYYKSTGEMSRDHNFLSPTYFGENRFQKPILFYWLILLSYQGFGVNWFAARVVAVVFAGLTVCLTWRLAKELFNRRVAVLSCLILATFPMFFRHARNAVPDMPLNFFIVMALWAALRFLQKPEKARYRYVFFISCALGFMIKGLAAVFVPLVTFLVYALWIRRKDVLAKINFPVGFLVMAAIVAPWFLYMMHHHGQTYTQYMLVEETRNRLLSIDRGNIVFAGAKNFLGNSLFYLKVIASYFAPWSLFALGTLPLAFRRVWEKNEKRPALLFLLLWCGSVFVLFSLMHFRINHYLLVLSTPLAILIGYFLLEIDKPLGAKSKILKSLFIVFLFLGFWAFSFLHVFLAGASKIWLLGYAVIGLGLIYAVVKTKDPLVAPFVFGLLLVLGFSQTKIMNQAGVSAHPALQRLAQVIHKEETQDYLIGVGSHDLHEKELQVYFDRKIEKVNPACPVVDCANLATLFMSQGPVYFLILQKDYETNQESFRKNGFVVLDQEYILRKRFSLDPRFLAALLKLDRAAIQGYLMEKVVLLGKGRHV